MTGRRDVTMAPVLRDDFSAGFFDAAADGYLAVRRCENGHFLPPTLGYMGPSVRCPDCLSPDIDWVHASGQATLISWTVVHAKDGSKQVAALVELAEGPWMAVGIDADSDERLRSGMSLTAAFVHPEGGEVVPVFVPS
jgi:uncharacterized OB-fold protein